VFDLLLGELNLRGNNPPRPPFHKGGGRVLKSPLLKGDLGGFAVGEGLRPSRFNLTRNIGRPTSIGHSPSADCIRSSVNSHSRSVNIDRSSADTHSPSVNIDRPTAIGHSRSVNIDRPSANTHSRSVNIDRKSVNATKLSAVVKRKSADIGRPSANIDRKKVFLWLSAICSSMIQQKLSRRGL